jgi:serine/threonine protein kinase
MTERQIEPGDTIAGTYRVLDFLGEGGMGLVYKVEHTMMAKIFALKLLRTAQMTDAVWKRFRVEAQAIARLDHANIVKIYDMSQTEDGRPFYTMDFLNGQSLDDYLQENGPLTEKEALPIFRQVCSGLAYAHNIGIIHRDIKPGNIMLLGDNINNVSVKIVDFGIAKLVNASAASQNLTRPGEVFGSPLYMSPEQCNGEKLDPRTDMYSVAVTLFQALTGRPPLLGKSAIETTMMHQTVRPPSLSAVAAHPFSAAIEEVVATMLEKNVDNRYQSLSEVANILLQIERGNTAAPGRNRNTNLPQSADLFEDQDQDTTVNVNASPVNQVGRFFSSINPFVYAAVALMLIGIIATTIYWQNENKHNLETDHQANNKQSSGDTALTSANSLGGGAAKQSKGNSNLEDLPNDNAAVEKALVNSDQYAIEMGDIEPETEILVNKFLASKFKYYSSKSKSDGRIYTTFEFPKDFSLGLVSQHNGATKIERQAMGRVVIEAKDVRFEANSITKHYPQLLKRFRPDDLDWLRIENLNSYNKDVAPNFGHLTELWQLEVYNTSMPDSDVKYFPTRRLLGLNIGRTAITSARLLQMKVVPQLKSLSVQEMKDIRPVLIELAKSKKIDTLDLSSTSFNSSDIPYLLKLTGLHTLYLKRTSINDDDLDKLTALTSLRYLNLDNCSNLSPRCLTILQKFKDIEILTVPLVYSNDDNLNMLKKSLKKLKKFR